jgi:sulfur-oxidizing protein SoxY
MRRLSIALGAGLLALAASAPPASAEADEATRAARWVELSAQIFGERAIEDGAGLVSIGAPDRAEDAALVPIKIELAAPLRDKITGLYLVIDDNPSPLAAHVTFGKAADASEVATRVRVDDYTYLHAVAETRDGKLYGVARFIKAAGGCSAPAAKDQGVAMSRLGQMKMTLRGDPRAGVPVEAHLLVSHPNSSGMQMDQVTRNYVPANFIREMKVIYNGEPVITMESDISISEDPSLTFAFVPRTEAGELKVEADDSNNRHFEGSWPVKPGT